MRKKKKAKKNREGKSSKRRSRREVIFVNVFPPSINYFKNKIFKNVRRYAVV